MRGKDKAEAGGTAATDIKKTEKEVNNMTQDKTRETDHWRPKRKGTSGGRRANGIGRCQGGTGRGQGGRGRCQDGKGKGLGNNAG